MSSFNSINKPIGFASDHAGYDTKNYLISVLNDMGLEYKDFGTYSKESSDYSDYAHPLATAVENGECRLGIAICGTGNGINMTMNKHQGIRAALCWNTEIAFYARAHNDANVLSLPGRLLTKEEFYEILKVFLNTPFEGGRHEKRINKIPCR
jgi:ribose 5-phosphate isomerase B